MRSNSVQIFRVTIVHVTELSALEKHPDFNPSVKIDGLDNLKASAQSESSGNPVIQTESSGNQAGVAGGGTSLSEKGGGEDGDDDMGLSFFQEDSASAAPKTGKRNMNCIL